MAPSWSPDGKKIAYHTDKGGDKRIFSIYLINTDGSGNKKLLADDVHHSNPKWSPDGGKIGFTIGSGKESEVCIVNRDGTGFIRLTEQDGLDFLSSWYPDSKNICFHSNRDGKSKFYTVNLLTKESKLLTN